MGTSIEDMAEDKDTASRRGRTDLTKSEREDRDARIVVDRVRGRGWRWLAEKYDLSERGCQDAFERWREHNDHKFEKVDAISVVHSMLDTYMALGEQAAEIAADADADNNKLGALNTQMSAMTKAAELCQATGILPKNLGTLKMEIDARVLAQKLVRVFDEHDVEPEVKRAVIAVLESGADAGDVPVTGLSESVG